MVDFNALDFDFNELLGYQGMVDSLNRSEGFEDLELGDPTTLVWDYDFLMTTMRTIVEKENHQLQRINGFSYFWMVFDFINEATIYALVNDREQVGQREIISTFKHWEYLPFDIKLDALDDIFTQENIDYENHPFGLKHSRKKQSHQKIIQFQPNFKKTNN